MARNVLEMNFSKIYLLYVQKVEKKGRTREELNTVIYWLTGHDENSFKATLTREASVNEFFGSFPRLNSNAGLITGIICGCRLEEIQDPIMRRIRYLDKLVDELAKGRPVDKILRAYDIL